MSLMGQCNRFLTLGAALATAWLILPDARAQNIPGRNAYVQTDLVSNGAIPARTTDPDLQNSWGIAFAPGSPFWIADNGTGVSTLYDGTGAKQALTVRIPPPGNAPQGTNATPTGIVWNGTSQFHAPGTAAAAIFIFATEDGTIAAWNASLGTTAALAVDNSARGAVYKGLATGSNANGNFLYAANFNSGKVDVFDSNFAPTTLGGTFTDPAVPAGFAPFGIQNVGGDIFVTFARQNDARHDDVAGPGNGFVDIFNTDGQLIQHFASHGTLNSPWGVTRASFGFGRFSDDILIGNFGDGRINAFSSDGSFLEQLADTQSHPIVIDGLWALTFGGAAKSSPDTLYFTAGPNQEKDGLFGSLVPADDSATQTSTR
jgi:uncharacterized protein (TIGR03118 family)